MSTLGSEVATLADWAKTRDPDGKTADVVELLAQTNGLLDDMLFKEGNLATGHQTTVRTGLPSVFWRLLNQGVQPSKSTSAQVTEGCGMLEAWSEVDKDLAELNGDVNAYRFSEAKAFIEAMNQEMASTTFYGNSSTDPEEFNGLAIRYSSLSAGNGGNIIDGGAAGGQTDCMSLYLVVWGENTIHGIFPKGSNAGIFHEDLGVQTVSGATGAGASKYRAYQEHWQWKTGLALRDWRYVVRIANVDKSNLIAESSAADLTKLMIKAIHRVPMLSLGKAAFYANRTAVEFLDIQRRSDVSAGGGLTYSDVDGKNVPTFRGIPIRVCDALTMAESVVA
jgi:hypothetical protein